MADDIDAAVDRMEGIVSRLMDTAMTEAKRGRAPPARMALGDLEARLRRRLQALVFGRNIAAEASTSGRLPDHIEVDVLLFDRVIDNLLSNAAKYTTEGWIRILLSADEEALHVEVSDSGRGIAPDRLDAIFRPGESRLELRAPNSYGVGLSVVVGLLAEIGGRLEVGSTEGRGSTFRVSFPRVPAAEAALESARAPSGVVRIRAA